MKAAREMQRQIVSFVAVTVAARLSVRNSASSPKKSLALSLRDTSPSSPTLVHLTSPVLMMKNSCPSSPCAHAGVALSRRAMSNHFTRKGRHINLANDVGSCLKQSFDSRVCQLALRCLPKRGEQADVPEEAHDLACVLLRFPHQK